MADTITFEGTSRFVKAGEITLHLNEVGEGPPLILLHGSGPGATSWSNFKHNLPALSRRFRVLAVDQPGYGLSDKPPFTRDDSVFKVTSRALAGLLDELGIENTHSALSLHGLEQDRGRTGIDGGPERVAVVRRHV